MATSSSEAEFVAATSCCAQRLARKNELKAGGTFLMALPDKHKLKFNIHKDAKTLIEAIEKRFGRNKETKKLQKTLLKQQYKNFTGSSSESLDQIHDRLQKLIISAIASAKIHVYALPNVATLSNAVIYSFFASQSNSLQLDNVECYNCYRKGHFARECRSPKETRRNGTAEPQRRNVPVETSTSNALVSQQEDYEAEISQNAPSFVQPTEQVTTPRPSVKTIETFIPTATYKTSIPKPKSIDNHSNRKACFVCKSLDHLIKECNFYEKKMAQTPARNHEQRGNHQQYASMTLPNPQKHVVPTAVLTQSKLVPITGARPVTADVPNTYVTRPRQAKTVVIKPYSPPRRNINCSPSPKASNFPPKVTAVKAPMVNVVKGVQGKWEWKPKCPILDHVSHNTSASMTHKKFDYNDALGRSKSVMAWVLKRN
uniref:Ribonuclease H-like domain-containing protein n=1 Tax=Tanacetum cinerariifolium TaxID=118510 RepID=A0A6L2KH27_TANCI|nr:ribonuclease H-like domain-containing protein [Tanacetum cinerariifolium]